MNTELLANQLVLIDTPTDQKTLYSRVWKTTTTPDIAIATGNMQKIAKNRSHKRLGCSNREPGSLTLGKVIIVQKHYPEVGTIRKPPENSLISA